MAVPKDKLTLQTMYLITQLLPGEFRHASSSTGGMYIPASHEVTRN